MKVGGEVGIPIPYPIHTYPLRAVRRDSILIHTYPKVHDPRIPYPAAKRPRETPVGVQRRIPLLVKL